MGTRVQGPLCSQVAIRTEKHLNSSTHRSMWDCITALSLVLTTLRRRASASHCFLSSSATRNITQVRDIPETEGTACSLTHPTGHSLSDSINHVQACSAQPKARLMARTVSPGPKKTDEIMVFR